MIPGNHMRRSPRKSFSVLTATLLQIVLGLLPIGSTAQPTSIDSQPVTKNNYRIKSSGLTFPDWEKGKRDGVWRFSLENDQKKVFNQLKVTNINPVTLDGRQVSLRPDALTLMDKKSVKVFILVDGSLSMLGGAVGVDKLKAAKEGITSLIDNLAEGDSVGVYAFDSSIYDVIPLSKDLDAVKFKVNGNTGMGKDLGFQLRGRSFSNTTDLYGAIEKLLDRAGDEDVPNIVVVSDGMQDTPESKARIKKGDFEEYKAEREELILEKISKSGARIFTVPLGDDDADPPLPTNIRYVDKDTLCKIGNEASGGYCEYIDLPDLADEASSSNESYQELLEEKLAAILEKIRNDFQYSYELKIPIDEKNLDQGKDQHEISLVFNVGGSPIPFPLHFTFLPGDRVPVPTGTPAGRSLDPTFIVINTDQTPPAPTTGPIPITLAESPSLFPIYLPIVAFLGFLGLIPMALQAAGVRRQKKVEEDQVKTLVIVVDKSSTYLGAACPNDGKIGIGQPIIVCPGCGRAHHLDCWVERDHSCYIKHCQSKLVIPEPVMLKHGIES